MDTPYVKDSQAPTGYRVRYQRLPAFDLTGFTKIVASGGEMYMEVRSDGRWEVLRALGSDAPTIYGVALSVDRSRQDAPG